MDRVGTRASINTAKWTGTSVARDSTYVFPFFPPHSACTTSRRCRLPLLAFDTLGQALMSSRSVQISLLDVSDRVPPDFSRMAESR